MSEDPRLILKETVPTSSSVRPAGFAARSLAAALLWLGGTLTPTQSLVAADLITTNRPISLEECFDLALRENLDLRIERINPALSVFDLEIARGGYDPLLTFSGSHSYNVSGGGLDANKLPVNPSKSDADSFNSVVSGLGPMGLNYNLAGRVAESYGTRPSPFDTANGNVGITLTQPLLKNFLTDNTRYNIAVARNRIDVSEWHLREQIDLILSQVETAYDDLIAAREKVKVQQEALVLAERLFQENQKRVSIGQMAKFDSLESQSQAAARQADLTSAIGALATARNNLRKLITSSFRHLREAELDPLGRLMATPYVLDLQESWRTGLTERPDLKQARLDVQRQGITVKYNHNQMLPEIDLNGAYGHGSSGNLIREFSDAFGDFRSGDKPNWTFGATLTFPLGNRAARARFKQSKATADQLVLQLKKKEDTALVEIDEANSSINTSRDKIDSTRAARVYAEQALAGEQQKYTAGSSTSFDVQRTQQQLTTARSDEISALSDYNKALVELFRAEGTILKHRNIQIEMK